MEIESYMYEDKHEVKVLEMGERKGQHQRPHAVDNLLSRETKEKGGPVPEFPFFPSHLSRAARASHPIAPPHSHIPSL
jgi:hypothetical protein